MRWTIVPGLFAVVFLILGTDLVGQGPDKNPGAKAPPPLPPWFKKLDLDKDGQIALWEWRRGGKDLREFNKWDLDNDGFITSAEAMRVFADLNKPLDPPRPKKDKNGKDGKTPMDDEDSRPVVYRAGKLPDTALPPWYKKLDLDGDGQVAFWEWREARKDPDEFKMWDRDDDGFITPEEAMDTFAALTTKMLKLNEGSLVVKDQLTQTGSKSPFPPRNKCRMYRVRLTAGTTYVIDLESTAFDAFLSLADANLRHLASDDDGGGNLNARIRFECKEDGVYHIAATGLGKAEGDFVLKIKTVDAIEEN